MLNVNNNITQVIGLLWGMNWDISCKGLASSWHLVSDQWKPLLLLMANELGLCSIISIQFSSTALTSEHLTWAKHYLMCRRVKIRWKYGFALKMLRIDGVALDLQTPNNNKGTEMPGQRHKSRLHTVRVREGQSLWFLLEVGRRVVKESQVILWASPGNINQNLKRNWECERIFQRNIRSRNVGSCGDYSKWSVAH